MIFSYTLRFGPIFWVQNFEFQYISFFWDGAGGGGGRVQEKSIFWGEDETVDIFSGLLDFK